MLGAFFFCTHTTSGTDYRCGGYLSYNSYDSIQKTIEGTSIWFFGAKNTAPMWSFTAIDDGSITGSQYTSRKIEFVIDNRYITSTSEITHIFSQLILLP